MTDPIAAMLIMIKNAGKAERPFIVVPHSKLKESIALCLQKEGYVSSVTKKTSKNHPVLEIGVKYDDKGDSKVHEVKRVSKPSRRMYMGTRDVRPVKNGYGILVLSTPKGIMTGKEARKELVGGEVLFMIW